MKKDDEKLLIDIPKWDKHQRELKQSGKRQREWIAMSTRIAHDPDFFNLTIEARYLWMMLLCHAGAVGVPMKLSASDARVMFKLRRNADFSPLINQGFITLLQDKTRQDRHIEGARPTDANYKPHDGMDRFAEKPEFNPRECPPKFQPKAETVAKIRQHHPQFTDADLAEGLRQMKAYVYPQDVHDWDVKYQNWMNKYRRPNGQAQQSGKRKTFDEIRAAQLEKMGASGEGYEPGEGSVVASY